LSKPHVIVYSRPGCHLCEEAKSVIQRVGMTADLILEEVSIEGDLGLLEKYRFDIPVILINGVEAFRHRVDEASLREVLKGL
jgi:hypothetical protein